MLPDDVFRAKRDRTIAALQQWHREIADCARIEEETAASFWRLAVTPFAAGCAIIPELYRGPDMNTHPRDISPVRLGRTRRARRIPDAPEDESGLAGKRMAR